MAKFPYSVDQPLHASFPSRPEWYNSCPGDFAASAGRSTDNLACSERPRRSTGAVTGDRYLSGRVSHRLPNHNNYFSAWRRLNIIDISSHPIIIILNYPVKAYGGGVFEDEMRDSHLRKLGYTDT